MCPTMACMSLQGPLGALVALWSMYAHRAHRSPQNETRLQNNTRPQNETSKGHIRPYRALPIGPCRALYRVLLWPCIGPYLLTFFNCRRAVHIGCEGVHLRRLLCARAGFTVQGQASRVNCGGNKAHRTLKVPTGEAGVGWVEGVVKRYFVASL